MSAQINFNNKQHFFLVCASCLSCVENGCVFFEDTRARDGKQATFSVNCLTL